MHDALCSRDSNGTRSGGTAHLAQNMLSMSTYRARSQRQFSADFRVGQPTCKEAEDFQFPGGKAERNGGELSVTICPL